MKLEVVVVSRFAVEFESSVMEEMNTSIDSIENRSDLDMRTTATADDENFEEVYILLDFPDYENTSFLSIPGEVQVTNLFDKEVNVLVKPHLTPNIETSSYKGTHEVSLGTLLFFDSDKRSSENYFIGKSIKKIKMELKSLPELPPDK